MYLIKFILYTTTYMNSEDDGVELIRIVMANSEEEASAKLVAAYPDEDYSYYHRIDIQDISAAIV